MNQEMFADEPVPRPQPVTSNNKNLRWWPAVLIIALMWVAIIAPARFAPQSLWHMLGMMLGPMVCALLMLVWWMFFSGLTWKAKSIGLLAFVLICTAVVALADASMGFALFMQGLPATLTVVVCAAVLTLFFPWPARGYLMTLAIVVGAFYWTLLSFEGVEGDISGQYRYRWQPSREQMYLVELEEARENNTNKGIPSNASLVVTSKDWPDFRGKDRDGRVYGVTINSDWSTPPKMVWRHKVGPAWSSFTVVGKYLFTQEQRGEDEAVVCYNAETGDEVWEHLDESRFKEAASGVGPRATPTIHQEKIYSLGAKGILNCLDIRTGKKIWAKDIAKDADAKVPEWGFSSSPLIVNDLVIVFAGGEKGGVLAYDKNTGAAAWKYGGKDISYSSAQLAKIDDVPQVLMFTNAGLVSLDPGTGEKLWESLWEVKMGARIVQPNLANGHAIFMATGYGVGTSLVSASKGEKGWEVKQEWKSFRFKPYFNDFIVHEGHFYGFNGPAICCYRVEDGKKIWQERGFDHGQLVFLAEQKLLVVLGEHGEVGLVEASPEGYHELGRFQGIEGKTWNHPVVVNGMLYIRNDEYMACYDLRPQTTATSLKE